VKVNVQNKVISLSQQEINAQLMTGLNPYLLQEAKLDELKLKKTSDITSTTKISEGIQGSLITGLIMSDILSFLSQLPSELISSLDDSSSICPISELCDPNQMN
jgi:hypothetical protein